MKLKSSITWLAAVLMLAVASPALAADASATDEAPAAKRKSNKRAHKLRRMDVNGVKDMVHTRLGKLAKRVDKVVAKKKVSPEVALAMQNTLKAGSAEVERTLDKAAADGKVTRTEVRVVRGQLKRLRKTLRTQSGKLAKHGKKARKRDKKRTPVVKKRLSKRAAANGD